MNFIARCRIICKGNILVKINPDFQKFGLFIENLPQIFEEQGQTLRRRRNHIKVIEVGGKRINVKRYRIPPYFFNRIIYVLIRDPKAKRSYDYALKLKSLGFDSPPPLGYYLEKKGLLLSICYLATEQEDDVYHLGEFENVSEAVSAEAILSEFGRYTAALHKNRIFHHDYSLGNVLFRFEDGRPRFSLIDINQMSFYKPTFRRCYKCFHRLEISPEHYRVLVDSYADAMNYDKEKMYRKILYHRNNQSKLVESKRWFKSLFKSNSKAA